MIPSKSWTPSMIRSLVLIASILFVSLSAQAQKWLDDPVIRVCENFICDDENHIDLTEEELAYTQFLFDGITSKATEAKVSKYLGTSPTNRSPATSIDIGRIKGNAYRATWATKENPNFSPHSHVDVYFINEQAFMLKWWFKGTRKRVEFHFIDN
jgi:hypothetical protein